MSKYQGVFGHCESIAEPVKKLQKSVDFSNDTADYSAKKNFSGVGDSRPAPDDNQLGKGHPPGFKGKVNDNRKDRNRSTHYGKG